MNVSSAQEAEPIDGCWSGWSHRRGFSQECRGDEGLEGTGVGWGEGKRATTSLVPKKSHQSHSRMGPGANSCLSQSHGASFYLLDPGTFVLFPVTEQGTDTKKKSLNLTEEDQIPHSGVSPGLKHTGQFHNSCCSDRRPIISSAPLKGQYGS